MNTATAPLPAEPETAREYRHTATYSPEDNKIRIYPAHRLDADEYARVKAAGFSWAPKQELFVAPMWTPARADLARELCGEIGDEDTSLAERAEERADRFDGYRENRTADAEQARAAVERITDGIPFGQPILVGHHSERHARKDAARIESVMRRAVDMWETAGYWKSRAAGAIRAAKYKELPGVRARRIKGIEADQRKVQKGREEAARWLELWSAEDLTLERAIAIANVCWLYLPRKEGDRPDFDGKPTAHGALTNSHPTLYAPRTLAEVIDAAKAQYPCTIAHHDRWLTHHANRLEYERAMLAEGGGLAADQFDLQPGGTITHRGRRSVVLRVNRKDGRALSVSVTGQGWTVGVEEITGYAPPTEAAAAAVATVTKLAPLVNYPTEGCARMTQAEWTAIYKDSKTTRTVKATETHAAHRVRHVMGYIGQRYGAARVDQWSSVPVFLTDAKETPAPLLNPPVKAPRRSTARKIAEASGVDTAGQPDPTPAEPETPAQYTRGEWGDMWFRVMATFDEADEAGANAFMTANPGASLLKIEGGRIYIAHRDDKGTATPPDRAAAREVLADLTAPTVAEVRAEIATYPDQRAAREARQAEAAPFDAMREALRTGQAVQVVSAPQLFPTPAHVAARMVELADVQDWHRVMEPSAGTGAILRALPDALKTGTGVYAVEIDPRLAAGLRSAFDQITITPADFLTLEPSHWLQKFDRILMNPPFANAADVAHILHARRFLAPGGHLVAICAAGPRQHEALQHLADSWEYLPPGTFEGTGVRTVLLTMGAAE